MSKTKYAQKIIFFYCYKCKDYELKTSPHYRAQKQRFARRRKAEKTQAETPSEAFIFGDPDSVGITPKRQKKRKQRAAQRKARKQG